MRNVGVHPRVPEHRYREAGYGDGQTKAVHACTQIAGVTVGDGRDQVRGPGQNQCGGKSPHDGVDPALSPSGFKESSIGPGARPCRETRMT